MGRGERSRFGAAGGEAGVWGLNVSFSEILIQNFVSGRTTRLQFSR